MARPSRIDPATFERIAARLPIATDPTSVRSRVEMLEHLLERSLVIPGLNRPIGLDVLLGVLPVVGSFAGAVFGGYMMWEARNLGISKGKMARMAGNVGFDWLLGLIPGIGIVPDFFFRSNTRNLRIILRHLDKHHPATVTLDGSAPAAP